MRTGDLTSLASAKAHLGIDPTDTSSDTLLAQFVRSQSRTFQTEVRRDILYKSYVEPRDGNATFSIEPYQYPVVGVDSVVVDGSTILPQPALVAGQAPPDGWVVVNDRIEIVHYPQSIAPYVPDYAAMQYGMSNPASTFTRGFGNVVLKYRAGFVIGAEPASVPATPGPYTVQTIETYLSDLGVKYASSNLPLAKVASAPIAGQYSVDNNTGIYTFAAADQGVAVLLSYAYVPGDVEQAVIDLVAWRFKERDRIGQRSASIAGENISFDSGLPQSVQMVIERYRRVHI